MYEELKQIIAQSQNIVFFGGAGVSTESGIPDFRSEKGLYKAKEKYNYSPEEMLSKSFFINKPELFYDYYKENLIHKEAKPNFCHIALAKLEQIGKLKAIVTQNIDNLHQLAGSKNVFELHGTVYKNYCTRCNEKFDVDFILNSQSIPKCNVCDATVRPDVVLYEEALQDKVVMGAIKAISEADTLIVGGTSLVVYPAAGLVEYFRGKNLILINKAKTAYDNKANLVINDPIGEVFKEVLEMKEFNEIQ